MNSSAKLTKIVHTNDFSPSNSYVIYETPSHRRDVNTSSLVFEHDVSSSSDDDDACFIPNKPMLFPVYGSTPPLVDNTWPQFRSSRESVTSSATSGGSCEAETSESITGRTGIHWSSSLDTLVESTQDVVTSVPEVNLSQTISKKNEHTVQEKSKAKVKPEVPPKPRHVVEIARRLKLQREKVGGQYLVCI